MVGTAGVDPGRVGVLGAGKRDKPIVDDAVTPFLVSQLNPAEIGDMLGHQVKNANG